MDISSKTIDTLLLACEREILAKILLLLFSRGLKLAGVVGLEGGDCRCCGPSGKKFGL